MTNLVSSRKFMNDGFEGVVFLKTIAISKSKNKTKTNKNKNKTNKKLSLLV